MSCFIPCREEIDAKETAALYSKHIFPSHGLPSKIISDRDPCFASRFTRELCNILGIKQNISTAYHPHTDGQSERTNQWLEQYLCFWTNKCQDNWATYLPMAEFTHNNWPNETMCESPFFLLMGYNPRADWTDRPSPIPQVVLCLDQFKQARKRAKELMIKAQQSWVKNKDMPKYKVRDQVWLEGRHLHTNQPTTKLVPRRHGPFKVVQVMSSVNYRLKLPTQWSIYPVFHIDLLTPYRKTPTHGPNYQRPPPDLVDREEEYKAEKILDSRRFSRKCKLQYLVKWKGYPDSENQWVDKDDVFADKALQEFKTLNPDSEVHIRHLYIPEDHIPTLSAKHMPSPTPSTIEDVILPSSNPQDYPISCIFRQLIEPKHGQVSPDFLEYQDTGSANARGNQEGTSMEANGVGMEAGANHQSLPQSSSPVSVTTISDISNLLCTHNGPAEYCHEHKHNPVFVPPPEGKYIIHNVLQHLQEAQESSLGPVVGYTFDNDNSDKENDPNATEVLP